MNEANKVYKRISIGLTKDQWVRLKNYSRNTDRSVASTIRLFINYVIDKSENKKEVNI